MGHGAAPAGLRPRRYPWVIRFFTASTFIVLETAGLLPTCYHCYAWSSYRHGTRTTCTPCTALELVSVQIESDRTRRCQISDSTLFSASSPAQGAAATRVLTTSPARFWRHGETGFQHADLSHVSPAKPQSRNGKISCDLNSPARHWSMSSPFQHPVES